MKRGDSKAVGRRAGRPKDPEKRMAILDAAQRLFYKRGVGAVALEEVAAAARVSRMTLYSHFGGKPALLSAVVERESARVLDAMNALRPAARGSLRSRLRAFARAYLDLVTRAEILAFDRLLRSEAADHPELVAGFMAAGPDRLRSQLADLLRQHVPNRAEQADRDAARLVVLLVGDLLLLERYGKLPLLGPKELDERAVDAVDFFLAAIGPEPAAAGHDVLPPAAGGATGRRPRKD